MLQVQMDSEFLHKDILDTEVSKKTTPFHNFWDFLRLFKLQVKIETC